jgi:hypothetical protein
MGGAKLCSEEILVPMYQLGRWEGFEELPHSACARWLQRCMLWMLGVEYEYIEKNVKAGVDFDIGAINHTIDY